MIIDFVTNHASDENAYFADAEAHGRASPYFSFFARADDGNAAHYFDWKNLENLNYDNPEVQRLMIAASSYWVRRFDVDGFRVDAAWGPRRRAAEFWPRWRAELKRIKPDLLLLAEASARDPYYVRHGFDAAYDWTGNLGEWGMAEGIRRRGAHRAPASGGDCRRHARPQRPDPAVPRQQRYRRALHHPLWTGADASCRGHATDAAGVARPLYRRRGRCGVSAL